MVVKNASAYKGSEVQQGFMSVFMDADKSGNNIVEKAEFPILIDGYFNSKHIKA